jgi:hypothetical protein
MQQATANGSTFESSISLEYIIDQLPKGGSWYNIKLLSNTLKSTIGGLAKIGATWVLSKHEQNNGKGIECK